MTVRNGCAHEVLFKAAFSFIAGIDDGRPCPGANGGGDACATPWRALHPGQEIVMEGLPELLWSYAAYIPGSDPRHYLSAATMEAYLAADDDFGAYCTREALKECVWWAVVRSWGAGGRGCWVGAGLGGLVG